MARNPTVPIPASGLAWVGGMVFGVLMLSAMPGKYRWLVPVWLLLAGLAWFANNKRRGPLESFQTVRDLS